MKISELFHLNKSQAELDFVNIDPDKDLPLFIDPFFLSKKNDNWSVGASLTIKSFFQKVIDLIRNNKEDTARQLFEHLHEPNTTCLGLSVANPQGRGVGDGDADKIFDSLLASKAIQSGLIQDIEDNILFVENFGKDKLSDMTTNIITKHLIEYTKNQCNLHNITLTTGISSGYYWDRTTESWETSHTEMLVINDKQILLVPKGIVSYCKSYTPDTYYNHFILNFLQNENLKAQSILVQERKDGTQFVTKKSLKLKHPQSKDFLRSFTLRHLDILDDFKTKAKVGSLNNQELTQIDLQQIKDTLINNLTITPSGNNSASDFHNLIIGILELIFYPFLINPVKEKEIHSGRKRIDITFDNAAEKGIFRIIPEIHKIFCPYIFVECKNYSNDIANPELDQLAGRFSVNRGKLGFIICRQMQDLNLLIKRCQDTFNDGRGLIIPLVDNDIIELLKNHNEFNHTFLEKFLADKVREIKM